MSDPASPGPTSSGMGPKPPLISGDLLGNIPQLVYLLYFVGLVIHPAVIVGVVLAYINRDEGSELERSHYEFQISTFWRGLLMIVLGVATVFILVGIPILLFWAIWTIIRCAKGLSNLSRGRPMPSNIGWGFG